MKGFVAYLYGCASRGLSVKLNAGFGEGVAIVSGGNIERRELLMEEPDKETGYRTL